MLDRTDQEHENEHLHGRITELASDLLNASTDSEDDSLKERCVSFYKLWSRHLTRIAAKLKAPRDQIEDLAQNVARKVLLRWDDFSQREGGRQLLALSYKMIHDEAVDSIRFLERRRCAAWDGVPSEPIDPKVSNPADIAERNELCQRMVTNLERLREEHPRYSWVLRERFLKGRPIQELAMEKGMSEHAVRCITTRALRRMRRLMAERSAGC